MYGSRNEEGLQLLEGVESRTSLLQESSEASNDCAWLHRAMDLMFLLFDLILRLLFAVLVAVLISSSNPYILALTATIFGCYFYYTIYTIFVAVPVSKFSSNCTSTNSSDSLSNVVCTSGQSCASGAQV